MNKDLFASKEYQSLILYYEAAMDTAMTQLNILLGEYELTTGEKLVDRIKSRIKEDKSIQKKLEKKGYDLTIENIRNHVHDMVGIRLICPFLTDLNKLVELLENSPVIHVHEKKDYVNYPKESGYKSIHLLIDVPVTFLDRIETVEVELQIRTLAMDFWASLDHKIQYKYQGEVPDEVKYEMRKCADDTNSMDMKMLHLNEVMEKLKNENINN